MSSDLPKILPLPEIVVNRIAAGEIINRPANIVKELIENSLDAGANQITVSITDGGLKLISVQDNGCGIRQEDLEILCQRFTTSKLRSYEDLQSIGTYGFRGEALASASHVSHLSVVTRCVSSQIGYKAEFIDGILKSKPKPCAANQGTLIKVEELFYNMPIRRKALRSPKEEYAKCLDTVTKYAFHNYTVSFLMRRLNTYNDQCSVDVRTSHADATLEKNLSILMGSSVAKDVLTFQVQNDALSFNVNGLISHPNYAGRKFNLVLFINNRLVECDSLKRGLELVTSQILPKGNLPFIYVNLSIKPQNVDVNVHPTKSQVHFLHESLILKALEDAIEKKLTSCNDSRTFYVGQIPSTPCTIEFHQIDPSPAAFKVYDHELVRTDAKKRKLEEFFVSTPLEKTETVQINFFDTPVNVQRLEKETRDENIIPHHEMTEALKNEVDIEKMDVENQQCSSTQDLSIRQTDSKTTNWPKRSLKLASIYQLKRQIQDCSSPFMTALFKEHTVVGCIDARLALIQHKTSLYLVDTTKLSSIYFYQTLVEDFGNFDMYRFAQPFKLEDLLNLAFEEWNHNPQKTPITKSNVEKRVNRAIKVLTENVALLFDYFSIEIDAKSGHFLALPILLTDYIPQLEGLADFSLKLAENIDKYRQNELECLRSICRLTSEFYSLQRKFCTTDGKTSAVQNAAMDWRWVVEHLLYTKFKNSNFSPDKNLLNDGILRKLTDLKDLYKVFERC